MADTKISLLTAATLPLAGSEVVPLVQGGVTKETPISNITALVTGQNQSKRQFFSATQTSVDDLVGTQDPFPTVNSYSVLVPSWATRAVVIANLEDMIAVNLCHHYLQLSLGNLSGHQHRIFWDGAVRQDALGSGIGTGAVDANSRQQVIFQEQFTVTALQNTTVSLRTKGTKFSGGGAVRSGISSTEPVVHAIDIEFFQV